MSPHRDSLALYTNYQPVGPTGQIFFPFLTSLPPPVPTALSPFLSPAPLLPPPAPARPSSSLLPRRAGPWRARGSMAAAGSRWPSSLAARPPWRWPDPGGPRPSPRGTMALTGPWRRPDPGGRRGAVAAAVSGQWRRQARGWGACRREARAEENLPLPAESTTPPPAAAHASLTLPSTTSTTHRPTPVLLLRGIKAAPAIAAPANSHLRAPPSSSNSSNRRRSRRQRGRGSRRWRRGAVGGARIFSHQSGGASVAQAMTTAETRAPLEPWRAVRRRRRSHGGGDSLPPSLPSWRRRSRSSEAAGGGGGVRRSCRSRRSSEAAARTRAVERECAGEELAVSS
ncbi:hypothetical protein C2845_PM03G05580 [Panicum miliaceum]|uniref:Uncharacterized protein n=1 Tax=Panicum miliaceum TaxID=4540 RepID=A0A3L6T9P3_PANMI|nr:hypothetical protein C2845_PM03G05580 [Panicum miliaceum]